MKKKIKKVLITGCGAAGKSTLAFSDAISGREIVQLQNIERWERPVIDLDYIRSEYELIMKKESKLPSVKRKEVVSLFESIFKKEE